MATTPEGDPTTSGTVAVVVEDVVSIRQDTFFNTVDEDGNRHVVDAYTAGSGNLGPGDVVVIPLP